MVDERAVGLAVNFTDDGRMVATVPPCIKCPRCDAVDASWDMALSGDDHPMAMNMQVRDGEPCLCVLADWHCECGYVVHCDLPDFTWWGQMGEGGTREDLKLSAFVGWPAL